jgi:hypothetical protein
VSHSVRGIRVVGVWEVFGESPDLLKMDLGAGWEFGTFWTGRAAEGALREGGRGEAWDGPFGWLGFSELEKGWVFEPPKETAKLFGRTSFRKIDLGGSGRGFPGRLPEGGWREGRGTPPG